MWTSCFCDWSLHNSASWGRSRGSPQWYIAGKILKLCWQELREYKDSHREMCTDRPASSADRLVAATSGLSVGESDISSDSSQHADVMRWLPCHSHSKFSHCIQEPDIQCVSKKSSPLKLFAIFLLALNLCNLKLPWLLPKHIPTFTPVLIHLSEYLCELYHLY